MKLIDELLQKSTLSMFFLLLFSVSAGAEDIHQEEFCKPLKEEVLQLLRKDQPCASDNDCTKVAFGCPFDCSYAANKGIAAKLRKMVQDYTGKCEHCSYSCPEESRPVVCMNQQCIFSEIAEIPG